MCKIGVVPRMGIFRPIPGTHLEKHPTPSPGYLVHIYRNLRELTMKYGVDFGLPGLRPNLCRNQGVRRSESDHAGNHGMRIGRWPA